MASLISGISLSTLDVFSLSFIAMARKRKSAKTKSAFKIKSNDFSATNQFHRKTSSVNFGTNAPVRNMLAVGDF